jgi:hypothetical protein
LSDRALSLPLQIQPRRRKKRIFKPTAGEGDDDAGDGEGAAATRAMERRR